MPHIEREKSLLFHRLFKLFFQLLLQLLFLDFEFPFHLSDPPRQVFHPAQALGALAGRVRFHSLADAPFPDDGEEPKAGDAADDGGDQIAGLVEGQEGSPETDGDQGVSDAE